nr:glycoside hydrolase family 3 C-terminal domain-containing protein [Candidatus Sigynarchaeota archaeon]
MTNEKRTRWNWNDLAGLDDAQIQAKAQEMLAGMTLKQKGYQMAGDESWVIGGIKMLRHYNDHPLPAGHDKKLGIEGMFFTDGPRGVVIGRSTCFPVSIARGATWNPDLERRVGNAIGIEARASGANLFAGVCINILRHPAWGRAQETYGEDPFHVGKMGVALVQGVQDHVMGCAKHYACNSIENVRLKVDVRIGERTLHEVYLPHFKACVDAGVASIMSAYNQVNGFYCGHNKHLLRDILKDQWGFKGFVMSDFFWGIRDGKAAILGGLDVEMPFRVKMKPGKIEKIVRKGIIPESMIDEAVLRVLMTRLKFNRVRDGSLYTKEKIASTEHVELAREVARQGIVLLKNEKNALPIDTKAIKKIAVIGHLANVGNIGDHGSSRTYPPHVITPLQGIENKFGPGARVTYNDGKKITSAARMAADADLTIIVAGYTFKDEGEKAFFQGGDRKSLRLHDKDEATIHAIAAANSHCIVVLEGGSGIITTPWRDEVQAILMAWYPGMEGGNAIADILDGSCNPSGRLPLSFPDSESELPYFDRFANTIEYDLYHGYRL